jgi:hypothetical protein
MGQCAPIGVKGVAPKIAPSTTPAATQPVKIAFAFRYALSAKRSITRGSKFGRSWAATSQEIGRCGIFLEGRPGGRPRERNPEPFLRLGKETSMTFGWDLLP